MAIRHVVTHGLGFGGMWWPITYGFWDLPDGWAPGRGSKSSSRIPWPNRVW